MCVWYAQVNFTPISSPDYERWVAEQSKPRFCVTLLTRQLQAEYLAIVTKILFDNNLNIDSITRLSGRVSLSGKKVNERHMIRSALQFEVSGKPRNVDQMREELFKVSLSQPVDIAVQEDDLFRRNRRLILFDMDSTLIQCEVIDELAKKAGVGKQVIRTYPSRCICSAFVIATVVSLFYVRGLIALLHAGTGREGGRNQGTGGRDSD